MILDKKKNKYKQRQTQPKTENDETVNLNRPLIFSQLFRVLPILGSLVKAGGGRPLMTVYSRQIKFQIHSRMLGTTMAELPVGMWMIFVGFGIPLIVLVSTTVRYALFWEAAREAADAACQAQYFVDPAGTTNGQGAVALATNTANNVAALFPGISINPSSGGSDNGVNCYIVTTPMANTNAVATAQANAIGATAITDTSASANTSQASTVTGPNTCLSSSANLGQNIYQIKVVVSGYIDPILNMQDSFPIAVPGLNQRMPVTVTNVRLYENGPGLSMYGSTTGNNSN